MTVESKNVYKINPTSLDSLFGGIYATLGIYKNTPLVHGGHGCVSYVKSVFVKHFKEPVNIATTGFYEVSAIYGGRENLKEGILNLISNYNPDIITILTTGLSETIGEDVYGIVKSIEKGLDDNVVLVPVGTPSYRGNYVISYDDTLKSIILEIMDKNNNKSNKSNKNNNEYNKNNKINKINNKNNTKNSENFNNYLSVIPGVVNPGDVREIKDIFKKLNININLLNDITSLDRPLKPERERFPKCDATINTIKNIPNTDGVIYFGNEGTITGDYLKKKGISTYNLKPPIGIENTDRFISFLSNLYNTDIPESILDDRGYALDIMIDGNSVFRNKKVCIYGSPNMVVGLSEFMFELGMDVKVAMSNILSKYFLDEMNRIMKENNCKIEVINGGDLYTLKNTLNNIKVDFVMGDSRGVYLEEKLNIPLLRVGLPILDRYNYHKKAIYGYGGALRLSEDIANMLISKKK